MALVNNDLRPESKEPNNGSTAPPSADKTWTAPRFTVLNHNSTYGKTVNHATESHTTGVGTATIPGFTSVGPAS